MIRYERTGADKQELLTQMRVKVLRAANRLDDLADMKLVEQQSRAYYCRSLEEGSHVAYLVYDEDRLIGTGGVSFYQVMPTYHNPSGMKAYIMNMYTDPDYRRRGIAAGTLDLLVKEAENRGVHAITLEATGMGRPLYAGYGFEKMEDEMWLPARGCGR